MSDINKVFLPAPHSHILVYPNDKKIRAVLDSLLEMLPSIYSKDRVTPLSPSSTSSSSISSSSPSCAGAAIHVAAKTLAKLGGKLLILTSNLPAIGVGALKNREVVGDLSVYNTKNEKTLFEPQDPFYQTLATKCAENRITVDLYVAANSYVDLATIGSLSTKTGGQIFFYPGFNAKRDGEALEMDIYRNCSRFTGWDAVMIIRASAGFKVSEHFGNFYHRRAHEVDLPTLDCDKTFAIRLDHEGKLEEKSDACIQTALLYTTSEGERRIRVHTLSIPITQAMASVFRSADLDAIINLSLKQAVRQIYTTTTPEEAQKTLSMACVESLYVYRKWCAQSSSAGQLILPEPLKLLPLYTLGLIKHPLFQSEIGRAVQQECRDRSRMPSSA
eukprot:TRINITY_DN25791_c0_g1_i1.p1 TRINITY_DN25791_c0_g1~~TRINITY_DN25791_c0_g1_i1.p1  ORF type:complete len:452 (+),score=85.46 TRINITY_DN25791_c0_g1_i1:194-1357(+)